MFNKGILLKKLIINKHKRYDTVWQGVEPSGPERSVGVLPRHAPVASVISSPTFVALMGLCAWRLAAWVRIC